MARPPLVLLGVGLTVAGVIAALTQWSQLPGRAQHQAADRQSQGQTMVQHDRIGQIDLLERLIETGRPEEALLLLAEWDHPTPLELRLLQSELLRRQGHREAARRALKGLGALHPDHLDVLMLQLLVNLDETDDEVALHQLSQHFQAAPKARRGDLGLLLAEMLIRHGQSERAADLYVQLAAESPTATEPILALAMLRREQGKPEELMTLMTTARQRVRSHGTSMDQIDGLAASWGLTASRIRAFQPAGSRRP